MGDLKEKRRCSKSKVEAIYRTVWRTRFGKGYGPVVRQMRDDDDNDNDDAWYDGSLAAWIMAVERKDLNVELKLIFNEEGTVNLM